MGVIADFIFWKKMNGFGSAVTYKEGEDAFTNALDKSMTNIDMDMTDPLNPVGSFKNIEKPNSYLSGTFSASKWFFACYFIEMLLFITAVSIIPFMKNKLFKNKNAKFNMYILCACITYAGIELLQFIINLGVAPGMDCATEKDGKCLTGWAGHQQWFKEDKNYYVCGKYKKISIDNFGNRMMECEVKMYGTDVYMIQFALARAAHGACLTFQWFGIVATLAVAGVMGWVYQSPNEMEAPNAEKPAFDYGAI